MIVDNLRSASAGFTKHWPHRGFFRNNWRRLNRLLLRLGATPVTTFKTKSGIVLQVDLNAKSQVDAYYTKVYEPESVSAVLALYDGQGAFLDVGANIGFYSTIVADFIRSRAGAGKVIGFEPFPGNVAWLKTNLANNGLEDYVRIVELGLSDRRQTLELVLREDFQQGSTTGNASVWIGEAMDAGFDKVEIPLDTLDAAWQTFKAEFPRIDFVKVDIEGHEDCFFQGARQTFEEQRPAAMLEVNKVYFRAKGADLDQTLLPYLPRDYRLYHRVQRHWKEVANFADCANFENVFVVPAERLEQDRYREHFVASL